MVKRNHNQPTIYAGIPSPRQLMHSADPKRSTIKSCAFTRVWAMPNHQTFKIKPIAELLKEYVGKGEGWVDPFAGNNSPAEHTNDHNPATRATHHKEAVDFARGLKGHYDGVIFDPPYSFRQVSEHYRVIGKKATALDTSAHFYEKVKSALCEKIKRGGYTISFGWNSNGFGKTRGFEIVEILLVSHGGTKNDTICVVERKIV